MRTDDLEFLIAQYADGSLVPDRVAEVEAILRLDPAARDLLAEYRSVDAALGAVADRQALPEVQWDRLHERLSRQVAALAAAGPAAGDELSPEVEEQLARYADGTLTAAEARLVEARLAADPHARLVAASYASLERSVDAVRADRPAVRWDALAGHLSATVTGTTAVATATGSAARTSVPPASYKMDAYRPAAATPAAGRAVAAGQVGVAGRIGRFLAQPRRLAVAACLLVAGGLSFQMVKGLGGGGSPPSVGPVSPTGGPGQTVVAETNGPTIVVPTPGVPSLANPGADTVVNVQIGPPPGGFDAAALSDFADGGQDTSAAAPRSSIVAKDRATAQDHAVKDANDTASAFPR